jgi:hypothetical protein
MALQFCITIYLLGYCWLAFWCIWFLYYMSMRNCALALLCWIITDVMLLNLVTHFCLHFVVLFWLWEIWLYDRSNWRVTAKHSTSPHSASSTKHDERSLQISEWLLRMIRPSNRGVTRVQRYRWLLLWVSALRSLHMVRPLDRGITRIWHCP